MCRMWTRITSCVKWDPALRLNLAVRALNLAQVESIQISIDPFHRDNFALREFWYQLFKPEVRQTNPKLTVRNEIRNDGHAPYFTAKLIDKRTIVFKTAGMKTSDVVMRFNRLLGNPEFGEFDPPERVHY